MLPCTQLPINLGSDYYNLGSDYYNLGSDYYNLGSDYYNYYLIFFDKQR